ncbi:hypothetical protein ISCGN_009538 [Ixodes scapularis]
MAKQEASSSYYEASSPCYDVDEHILRMLWDEDTDTRGFSAASFDQIDRLIMKRGMEVSTVEDLLVPMQRMKVHKPEWPRLFKVQADGSQESGRWKSSLVPGRLHRHPRSGSQTALRWRRHPRLVDLQLNQQVLPSKAGPSPTSRGGVAPDTRRRASLSPSSMTCLAMDFQGLGLSSRGPPLARSSKRLEHRAQPLYRQRLWSGPSRPALGRAGLRV